MADMIYPNFLIVGAARCGTTSLYNYLIQHPEIFMSENKEPCFFSFANEVLNFSRGTLQHITDPEKYFKLFSWAQGYKAIGEASTMYLYLYEKSIQNIKKYLPAHEDLKIIIILRNPADRAYSQYQVQRKFLREELSFEESLQQESQRMKENFHHNFFYSDRGYYCKQVKAYLDNFKNVKIILYDELKSNQAKVLKDIFAFLEVNENFKPSFAEMHNVSGIPKIHSLQKLQLNKTIKNIIPPFFRNKIKKLINQNNLQREEVDISVLRKLKTMYGDDIDCLAKLIQKDLKDWKV